MKHLITFALIFSSVLSFAQYEEAQPFAESIDQQDLKELHLLIMTQMGMEFLMNQFHVAEQIQIL